MKKIINKISIAFNNACDKFSHSMREKCFKYNDMGALVVKLSLISLLLMVIILGLTLALIFL